MLDPWVERSPKVGTPLQYSRLENHMDRGAWQATVHGVTRVGHDLATKPLPTNSTHSNILAWEIPWTEEPGGLQSLGSQELDTT